MSGCSHGKHLEENALPPCFLLQYSGVSGRAWNCVLDMGVLILNKIHMIRHAHNLAKKKRKVMFIYKAHTHTHTCSRYTSNIRFQRKHDSISQRMTCCNTSAASRASVGCTVWVMICRDSLEWVKTHSLQYLQPKVQMTTHSYESFTQYAQFMKVTQNTVLNRNI